MGENIKKWIGILMANDIPFQYYDFTGFIESPSIDGKLSQRIAEKYGLIIFYNGHTKTYDFKEYKEDEMVKAIIMRTKNKMDENTKKFVGKLMEANIPFEIKENKIYPTKVNTDGKYDWLLEDSILYIPSYVSEDGGKTSFPIEIGVELKALLEEDWINVVINGAWIL